MDHDKHNNEVNYIIKINIGISLMEDHIRKGQIEFFNKADSLLSVPVLDVVFHENASMLYIYVKMLKQSVNLFSL